MRIVCGATWVLVAGLTVVTSTAAAQTRADFIRDGIEADQAGFGEEVALQLLVAGMNPAFGPPDAPWRDGLRTIARIHVQATRDSLAAAWLRWGLRQDPSLQVPPNTMIAPVFDLVRQSLQAGSSADSLAEIRWIWPADAVSTGQGTLRATGSAPNVRILVVGQGVVSGEMRLNPGSYTVRATASGYRQTEVVREVLPGITTVLDLRLVSNAVAAAATPSPGGGGQVPVVRSGGGGFPWPLALLGIAAGGAVVIFAGGGDDGGGNGTNPTTGGIIVALPKR